MINILFYVVCYYNVDLLLQNLYLPYVVDVGSNDTIANYGNLHFLFTITSYFMLFLYSYSLAYNIFFSKAIDRFSIGLTIVYIKFIVDIIIYPNMTLIEHEMHRGVMWVFATPLMLKMYCNSNDLSLQNINLHYHIIAIVPHVLIIPFKPSVIYITSTVVFSLPAFLFLKSLYKYHHLPFTNLYITVWFIYMAINIIDITQIFSPIVIHALYNIADTICKFLCNVVISNYNEKESILRKTMDLQSVNFTSHMIKTIKEYETNNVKLSPACKNLISYSKRKFLDKIPNTSEKLKIELLKKILPFDLDDDFMKCRYGDSNYTPTSGSGSGKNKEIDMICIMFMDIVNYTELAKKHNGDTIFKLLDNIYHHFDTIIKKYPHLQKIETIGDAYMVVGDIFRQENNHHIVIKEIILLAIEFMSEIKNIKTPDDAPLCIRIGINLGTVNVGILGNEIPRLCVVGNAVNVAARLQSTADADTIQISRHIYEKTEEINFGIKIDCVEKENIFLKNIGSVTTYNICPFASIYTG